MKNEIILFTEICQVCKKEMKFVKDLDYIDPDGVCRAFKAVDSYLCDKADDSGCFLSYHNECFSKHSCPVHPKKK